MKVQPYYLSTFWTPPRLEALRLGFTSPVGFYHGTGDHTAGSSSVNISHIHGLGTGTSFPLLCSTTVPGTTVRAVNSVINISDRSGP